MKELHENEQYFFTDEFEDWYVNTIADNFKDKKICCVCCPMIGKRLNELGLDVSILDIDRRFESHGKFVYYDITDPVYLSDTFDVIVCDPPFFNVSFHQLKKALNTLRHYNTRAYIFMTYLKRRESTFIDKFKSFSLFRMDHRPTYKTVDVNDPKRDIRLYTNYNKITECKGD